MEMPIEWTWSSTIKCAVTTGFLDSWRFLSMSQTQKEYAVDKITRPPIHPGEIFAEEVMPELRKKRTIGEIARVLGVSRQHLYRMMQGKISLTPDMAAKIGALVGNGARIWLAMQADYDAWEATKRLAPALKKIRAEA